MLITFFAWERKRNRKENGLQLGVAAIFVDALQTVPERNNLSLLLAVPSEILQLLSFWFKFRQEVLIIYEAVATKLLVCVMFRQERTYFSLFKLYLNYYQEGFHQLTTFRSSDYPLYHKLHSICFDISENSDFQKQEFLLHNCN